MPRPKIKYELATSEKVPDRICESLLNSSSFKSEILEPGRSLISAVSPETRDTVTLSLLESLAIVNLSRCRIKTPEQNSCFYTCNWLELKHPSVVCGSRSMV